MVADPRQKLGVAVFVKTPGFSPVKTRLAQGIGQEIATAFYERAVAAIGSVVKSAGVTPLWAVAEADDAAVFRWRDLPVVAQGEGELGRRIATVYDAVWRKQLWPVMIGADAPQLDASVFRAVAAGLQDHEFVIGPARDGGYYLLAGRQPVPSAVFEAVSYSASTTCAETIAALSPLGRVKLLPPLTDVDTHDDLKPMQAELGALTTPTQDQLRLWAWLRSLRASSSLAL